MTISCSGQKVRCKGLGESGVVLIIALMVLMVISLLGIAGMMMSTTEIQIAGNQYRGAQFLYSADAGIEVGRASAPTLAAAEANPWKPFLGPSGNLTGANYTLTYTVDTIYQYSPCTQWDAQELCLETCESDPSPPSWCGSNTAAPVQCPPKMTGPSEIKENWCDDYRVVATGTSAAFSGSRMRAEASVSARCVTCTYNTNR